MSDWNVGELSLERWIEDLEAVIAASAAPQPFALLGISSGAAVCAAYAARHPERVSHLLLYGGYARGWAHRSLPDGEREYLRHRRGRARRVGPRQSRFPPGLHVAVPARRHGGADRLAQRAVPEDDVGRARRRAAPGARPGRRHGAARGRPGAHPRHPRREDAVCPDPGGPFLAAGIPGAQFVELESKNHILLESEPAWARFKDVVLDFMGLPATRTGEDPAFEALSPREREVLSLVTEGLSNAEIGERLSLSEKTVRNHLSSVFDKLGVWTRAQAMVFARDRGFRT
jgi:DNA-binding CsgD family transcriptional regulator/pimeloyl-ACP methyl ester carboxylesterase